MYYTGVICMAIRPVSFGIEFKTREVANIVSGKDVASGEFLSSISGISIDDLLTRNSSDMYIASSGYCAKEIARTKPIFKPLLDASIALRDELLKKRYNDEKYVNNVNKLFEQRDKKLEEVCSQLGDTIDIEPFYIPFLK